MGHIVKTDILPLLFRNSAIRWKAAVVFAFWAIGVKGAHSFKLARRPQNVCKLGTRLTRCRPSLGAGEQKFFVSFFQKRNTCFFPVPSASLTREPKFLGFAAAGVEVAAYHSNTALLCPRPAAHAATGA